MGVGNEDTAHAIGLDVLLWIAADPERAEVFMRTTGTSIAEMRDRAKDPEFLGFVIDHISAGDDALLEFCESHAYTPEDVMRARTALPGGRQLSWT